VGKLPYDKSSVRSIVAYASNLTGKSLREAIGVDLPKLKDAGKGNLGLLVERYYFLHSPPNDHNPDFPEAGLELKSTGLKRAPDVPGGYKAKERLVLNLINYHDLANDSWESSGLLTKSRLLLLLFYLYDSRVEPMERKFILPPLLLEKLSQFESDLIQIKEDWHVIQKAVLDGRAHEISESDTRLLGACTKSSDSSKVTSQPFSDIPAKPRAFALKQGYLTYLLSPQNKDYISIISPRLVAKKPALAKPPKDESVKKPPQEQLQETASRNATPSNVLESVVFEKFEPFYGLSETDLARKLHIKSDSRSSKNFYRQLVNRILVDVDGVPLELVKEGIQVKTVRLELNAKPKEHMSFPNFDYLEVNSQDWADSEFASQIEQKFLFVVFKRSLTGDYKLDQVKFWSMPTSDRHEAERVWLRAKKAIIDGKYNQLPRSVESRISHVRPHARNRLDTLTTPQGGKEVKRCFWLNRDYVAQILK
jgi:hypothetical protein